jgi:hypothetical protein
VTWPRIFLTLCLSVFATGVAGERMAANEQEHVMQTVPEAYREGVRSALAAAGGRRAEIAAALDKARGAEQEAMAFLVTHMPPRDLGALSTEFLVSNVRVACETRDAVSWGRAVPDKVFLNDVLPYACLNERRDNWRGDFRERFLPTVKACRTPGEAAIVLNREVYKQLNVRYHATKRPKPDQSPYESADAGYASCTGLSILLVDACRSVCVPARIVGTPMWTNKRGNHSWVEVWDSGGWHFMGAAESRKLDDGWFVADAAAADPDNPRHWIYASSWEKTGLQFPLIWAPRDDYVPALNVTERYRALGRKTEPVPGDEQEAMHEAEDKRD